MVVPLVVVEQDIDFAVGKVEDYLAVWDFLEVIALVSVPLLMFLYPIQNIYLMHRPHLLLFIRLIHLHDAFYTYGPSRQLSQI